MQLHLGLPGEPTFVPWKSVISSSYFFFYPSSISEVNETPQLCELMFCVHTHIHTHSHSYFTSCDVQNLSPASAPLTVGKGKNPSPSPWVCVSLSKRWVTAIGLFVATLWALPCLFRSDIWTLWLVSILANAQVQPWVMRGIRHQQWKQLFPWCCNMIFFRLYEVFFLQWGKYTVLL